MCLVVFLRLIYCLDRDLGKTASAGNFQEHLHLIFESLALNIDEILHEIKRDAAKARLRVTDLYACNV